MKEWVKWLIWRIRAAKYFHRKMCGHWSMAQSWDFVCYFDRRDCIDEDPEECVDDELSCWND